MSETKLEYLAFTGEGPGDRGVLEVHVRDAVEARAVENCMELLEALEATLPWESHPAACDCPKCRARALIARVRRLPTSPDR